MISTIIFDLSEVLLHGLWGIEHHINELYGLRVENSQWKIREQEAFFHGQITEDQYFDAVIKEYGWQLTVNQLKHAVRRNFTEIKGTRKLITNLKKNGYTLGLLSIHAKEWIEYCEEKFGYHHLFNSITYSFEISVSKPDPRSFELIMDKLKVKPEECVFIDDHQPNVDSAINLGMNGILFKNAVDLKKELKKINIRIN